MFDTIAGLKARGHEVAEFSTRDSRNEPSDYAEFFTTNPGELSGQFSFWQGVKIFKKFLRSEEVEKNLRALILATEPDVAHLHGVYHHLSASTFTTLKKMGVPMVLTVHDFFPLTPNHNFLCQGKICERGFKHKYYHCAFHKCVNNAFLPSVAGSLEAYYYWLRGIWKMVDTFICPSEFWLDKLAAWGFPKSKLTLVRNPFVVPENYPPLGDKIVYLGRYHSEKGIKTWMQALPWLRQYEAIVAGSGPEDAFVSNFIQQYSLTNVKKIGWVEKDRWQELMRQAKVVVIPSLFYENCSLAILEALSYGRLVVATDRGGNPELVKDGVTGFLAKPDDSESLARAIKTAMNTNEPTIDKIIQTARNLVKTNHDPGKYFESLEKIYQEVINKNHPD